MSSATESFESQRESLYDVYKNDDEGELSEENTKVLKRLFVKDTLRLAHQALVE